MSSRTRRTAAACLALGAVVLGAVPANAQEGIVTVEGRVWFDRDADGAPEAGEPPLVWTSRTVVQVFAEGTKQWLGESTTDADGRYRISGLPAGTGFAIYNRTASHYEATTGDSLHDVGGGTYDFGVRGGTLTGSVFVDSDRDGVKQPHEKAVTGGDTVRLLHGDAAVVVLPAPEWREDGTYAYHDLAFGRHVLLAQDRWPDFKVAPTAGEHDVDPKTREKWFQVVEADAHRADVRYTRLDADFAVDGVRLEPAREAHRIGDEVTLVASVTNRGEAADVPEFTVFDDVPEFVRASDNLEVTDPMGIEFGLREPLEAGKTTEVRLTYRLDDPAIGRIHLFVRPVSKLGRADVNAEDNHAIVSLAYLPGETATTTPTPTTPGPGATGAPTPGGTTTPGGAAVVAATGGSGLASTGAAPLGIALTGLLLLGGGALVLLAARRRRA